MKVKVSQIVVEECEGDPGGKQQPSWSQTGETLGHWDMTRHDTVAPHEF